MLDNLTGPGATLLVVTVAVALLAIVIGRQFREIGEDERLVVFRMGQTNPSLVRGPGRTLLVPKVDRGVRVSLAPQRFDFADIPALTSDGRGILVDVELVCRVTDPLSSALNTVVSFPFSIRGLARGQVRRAAATLSLGDALEVGRVEGEIRPAILQVTSMWGAGDVDVKVRRVRPGDVSGTDEGDDLDPIRAERHGPDPDTAGSHTLRGDLAWGVGRLRRMTRIAIYLVPVVTIGMQLINPFHIQPMTTRSLFSGFAFGLSVSPWLDVPGASLAMYMISRIGWRRTGIWFLMAIFWSAAAIGLLLFVSTAAGLG